VIAALRLKREESPSKSTLFLPVNVIFCSSAL
jgi:hypothetical protein